MKQILNTWYARLILVLFGFGFILLIWWLTSYIIANYILDTGVKNIFFPGPEVVIPVFFDIMDESNTWVNIGYTLLRLFESFAISFVLAFILGIIAGLSKSFETFLKPAIIAARTLPPAVLILSFKLIMSRHDYSLLIIISLVMFPILYEAVLSGFKNIDPAILQATKLETPLHSRQAIFKVLIPSSRSYILLGIVQTLGLGLKVAIMSEALFATADCKGIGVAFYISTIDFSYDVMFAYAIYAILIIMAFDLILHRFKKQIKADM